MLAFTPRLTRTQVDRNVNENFKFNQETEFVPILGQIADKLNEDSSPKQTTLASSIQENHHPAFLSLLAEELNVSPEEIHDFELYEVQCLRMGLILTIPVGISMILNHLASSVLTMSLFRVRAWITWSPRKHLRFYDHTSR